jgi:hypothetical protein
MNNNLRIGDTVKNFGTTARVVGFFSVAGMTTEHDGDPILRELSPVTGRLRGGKWVADPSKCEKL